MGKRSLHECMHHFPGAVLELSADGVVLDSNGHLDEALGRELAGCPLASVLDETSQLKWSRVLATSDDEAGPGWPCELVFQTDRAMHLRAFQVAWGGEGAGRRLWLMEHEPTRRAEHLYDAISELNSELVQAQREIAREQRRLADALREATAAVIARDEVLAFVSHDLRSPLSTIQLAAGLLEMPIAPEKKAEQVQVIRRVATGMSHLIEDLLAVSEVEAGHLSLERVSLPLGVLFEEVCAEYENQARQKSLQLRWSVADDVPTVHADRSRLAQVLANLVGNAIKFTPEGGSVALTARLDGAWVEVRVEDTGTGISADDLSRIFIRFWHASTTKRGGAGLGLAIAKGLVEAHGGRIWVESTPGEGATFFFTLPVGGG